MNTRNPGIANFGVTIIQSRQKKQWIDVSIGQTLVRKFKDAEIPPEFIRKALECATKAPTARNAQPWIFVVVKNKETLAKIAELAPNGKFIEGAAVGFLVFGKADWQYVIEDCSAATENLLLALHSYGYGGCWIAGARRIMQRMCVNS